MIIKNWVYYMQQGLQSMWPKKKKSPLDKGRIATSNEGFTGWSTSGPKKKIKFKECGCLPDCGCKK